MKKRHAASHDKQDKKSKYRTYIDIFSNIAYALQNIWKWDKAFYLFFLPSIPLAVLLPFAENYFPKVLLDAVTQRQSVRRIGFVIAGYFGVLLLVNLFHGFCGSKLQARQYSLSLLYQNAMNEKFMRTDYENTDSPQENLKYQNAMNDACSGQCSPEFVWHSLMNLLVSILGIFTYGSVIVTISPWILAFLLLSAYVTYLVSRWQRDYIEKNRDSWTAIDRKIGYLQSFSRKFDHAKDIRLYGMSDWLDEMLEGFQRERFAWTKKVSGRGLGGAVLGALLMLIQNSAAYGVLIAMVLGGRIGAGDFVFYFATVTGFSAWLKDIGENYNDVVQKGIRIGYYRAYFQMGERYNHGQGCPLPPEEEWPVEIAFSDVSYRYPSEDGEKYALRNINLRIRRGEKIAIVGPNGAGKTTLVKLLCGLYYPMGGDVRLGGRSVSEYNIEEYYSLFSAVFQDIYLLPVTIAEFVSSGEVGARKERDTSDGGGIRWERTSSGRRESLGGETAPCEEEIRRERVAEVLRQAGLAEKIASLPKGMDSHLVKGVFEDSVELSGGEEQKLMLARALYKDAPVIVLDEPTAALDPIAENELYLKYNDLTAGKTAVYISHRLASTRFCDRILYLENGEIAECGTHDELMELGGKYASMFALQSRYYKEDRKDA